jgi:hypothetical protein
MRTRTGFAALACFTALVAAGVVWSEASSAAQPASGDYIVVFKNTVPDVGAATAGLERALGFRSRFQYQFALKGFAASLTPGQLNGLRSNPNVDFVGPDGTLQAVDDGDVGADATSGVAGFTPVAAGETIPPGIRRIGAATTTTVHQKSGIKVAVLDTGSGPHPDLTRTKSGKDCVNGTSTANDDNGHGTHVAGTIAAKNQGAGVVGVAPGTTIVPVKVLNSSGSGAFAQVICGIDWVTAHGPGTRKNIRVANMSLGGAGSNDNNCGRTGGDALHTAICSSVAAGITYVVAAGNSGSNFSTFVPAAYPEVLTVTAMTDTDGQPGGTGPTPSCSSGQRDDSYATFSNFAGSSATAAQNHTIAGPGVCVLSTWLGNGYATISGTSMATPHVTGTVALCINDNGVSGPCTGKTPAQIVQQVRSDAAAHATTANGFTGDPNHAVTGKYFGFLAWAGGY